MKIYRKIIALLLAAASVVPVMLPAQAKSSSEIQKEIDQLEKEAQAQQEKLDEIQADLDANWDSIEEMVAYKNGVDQQIFLIYSQIDNLNQQITAYGTLIVETQQELDDAEKALEELNEHYRARIRAMEEEGAVSYWEVLFKANSFLDLIDRLNMIKEIAQADRRMMAEIEARTQEVREKKESMVEDKAALEESRKELQAAWNDLEAKRAESDEILRQLSADHAALEALHDQEHEAKQALIDEIAKAEKEYTAALRAEEEERRRQEEEKRRQEEEKRREEEEKKKEEGGGSKEPDKPSDPPPSSSDKGWLMPCSYVYISSPYGWRSSGWHNGVDFAAHRGTPIYATRSGTVTKAVSLTYSYGNYVTINHGDGFSSLYAHMDYFVVKQGQYVQQGQLIGYVGSTGNSTGNHLHLTFFYNGETVNPMDYLG